MSDKIDFVLPWVDNSDPLWQKQKTAYEVNISDKNEADHGEKRYRDTHTLKYVLRSIEENCPWYHKIYLITNGHYPKWLDIHHPKIELVTHEQLYFDKKHLPTFNSSSIEMNLPNLQGVSEKFIYMNDDFIILRPLSEERFFVGDHPVDFLMHGWIPRNRLYQKFRDSSNWVKSLNNNIELINSIYSPQEIKNKNTLFHFSYKLKGKVSNYILRYIWRKYFFISHWHNAQPYRMSLIKEVYEKFEKPMMLCSQNRFRSDSDLTQYLYRYYHLAKEKFYPYSHNDNFRANITSINELDRIIETLHSTQYSFVSIYDNYSCDEEEQIITKLAQYLGNKFPQKASFEL